MFAHSSVLLLIHLIFEEHVASLVQNMYSVANEFRPLKFNGQNSDKFFTNSCKMLQRKKSSLLRCSEKCTSQKCWKMRPSSPKSVLIQPRTGLRESDHHARVEPLSGSVPLSGNSVLAVNSSALPATCRAVLQHFCACYVDWRDS